MSYNDWIKCKIEDLGNVVSGGTPSTKIVENWDGDISWITPKDLSGFNNRFISTGERKISVSGLANSSAKLMPKGSVLFSSRAPIGYVAIAAKELSTNQGFKSIVSNDDNYNIFIFYLMKYITDDIKSIAGGSTFSEISGTTFKNFDITIPKLNEQKAIANILSSLDDKIELNNKINQNLEELAQTLYKHWFVDFEFPNENGEPYKSSGGEMVNSELGLIPKGWEILNLQDRFAFERGIEPGSKNYQQIKDSESIPFYRVGDLNQKSSLFVNKALVKNKVVFEDDILVSFDGAIGRIGIGFSGAYSTGLRKVYDKENEISNSYVYNVMKSSQIQDIMNAHANGTTILHAGSSIPFLKVVFNNIIVKDYENITNPIFDKILETIKENQKLAEIRDTLLPKLMNGEIEVPI